MTSNIRDAEEYPETDAGTILGAGADETEIVPPLPAEATPELAWSTADDDDGSYSWGTAAQRASVVVLSAAAVAVVIAALIGLGFYIYDRGRSAPSGTVRTVPAAALPPSSSADGRTATVGAPPPSTVTVAPAPTTTVTVQAAPPPTPAVKPAPALPPAGGTDVFTICPDGHEGVVGDHTSCAFAANVRQIFYASGMSNNFRAYSPVTGDGYEMVCAGRYPAYFTDGSTRTSTRCYGGDNAEAVIW